MERVLVAYSGGVDSSYLAFVATSELGADALCVLGLSPSVSAEQRDAAELTARRHSFRLRATKTDEVDDPRYAANPTNRCYYCKTELYGRLTAIAAEEGISYILDGANADDVGDHRPGRAAASEKGVVSPLVEVGLTKSEIRELSRMHGLASWDKPASPCLSSRIAYGVPVTIERLSKVEAAERFLRNNGFREFRVRVHGELARIEIAKSELSRALSEDFANRVSEKLKEIGFKYVTLDLQGFRSGAMNEVISNL